MDYNNRLVNYVSSEFPEFMATFIVFITLILNSYPIYGTPISKYSDNYQISSELKKRAEEGDAVAQMEIGAALSQEAWRKYAAASKWIRKAAESGNTDAQVSLARQYAKGLGVEQNYTEAAKWAMKAAEQGNSRGQCDLGMLYYDGHGVDQDYKEAAKWLAKAAEAGVRDAQLHLGLLYSKGRGVEQSYEEAYYWLWLATAPKHSKDLQDVRQHLGLAQQDAIIAKARKWVARHGSIVP